MTKPRPVGRPPRVKSASDNRITLRASDVELKRWRKAAGKRALSEWIRLACEHYAVLG